MVSDLILLISFRWCFPWGIFVHIPISSVNFIFVAMLQYHALQLCNSSELIYSNVDGVYWIALAPCNLRSTQLIQGYLIWQKRERNDSYALPLSFIRWYIWTDGDAAPRFLMPMIKKHRNAAWSAGVVIRLCSIVVAIRLCQIGLWQWLLK
jgi:hypothetical protein